LGTPIWNDEKVLNKRKQDLANNYPLRKNCEMTQRKWH
jgi:hypothetical protein